MTITIAGYGIQSPTGTSAPMSTATVRGGISRIQRNRTIEDKLFEPISMGMAQYLPDDLPNLGRFIELAVPAFEEAIAPLLAVQPAAKNIPVLVGLPKERPGLDKDLTREIINELKTVASSYDVQWEFTSIREDHDSGFIALKNITEQLRASEAEFCLIGGVDSFVSEETVSWLENQRILKCSTNRFGMIPGEAAAFCLLCSEEAVAGYDLSYTAQISGFGSSYESKLPGSGQATSGEAFRTALQQAIHTLPEGDTISEIYCMLKGLRHEAEEFAYGNLSIGACLEKPGEYLTLASRWGDVGAASAPALLAFTAESRKLGFTQPGNNLVFTMSPGGSRSAALLKIV